MLRNQQKLHSPVGLSVILAILMVSVAGAQTRPGDWVKYEGNPVLDIGEPGSWEQKRVWNPAVVFDGDAYRMWYQGDAGGLPAYIGYATSADGLSWTRHGGNPIVSPGPAGTWDELGVFGPSVIADASGYKMWYPAVGAAYVWGIGYATSPDGMSWTKHEGNPVIYDGAPGGWTGTAARSPSVIKDSESYKMWYHASDGGGRIYIGYATSSDGISWVKHGSSPVFTGGPDGSWDYRIANPRVVYANNSYHMWYDGRNSDGTSLAVGYATSVDGITWRRQGRVLERGSSNSFDSDATSAVAVLLLDDRFKMWYSGWDDGDDGRIGFASAPILNLEHTAYLPIAVK